MAIDQLPVASFQFSLRDLGIALVGCAAGLAIWRLPQGTWTDIPLAALSFYFLASLLQRTLLTRSWLIETPNLPVGQQRNAKFFIAALVSLASTLVLAWFCRYFAADERLFTIPKDIDDVMEYMYEPVSRLPADLALLAMLAAAGIGTPLTAPAAKIPQRNKLYLLVALALTLLGVVVYWASNMIIPLFVYIAVEGMDIAQPAKLQPPVLNIHGDLRIHHFMSVSFVGLAAMVLNLLIFSGLCKFWARLRYRLLFLGLLTIGLFCEFTIAHWLGGRGISLLSPRFSGTFHFPTLSIGIMAGLVCLFAVVTLSWRCAASARGQIASSRHVQINQPLFHESWRAPLLLGVLATNRVIDYVIGAAEALNYAGRGSSVNYFIEFLVFYPDNFLWLAVAIGGLTMAWSRWRKRRQPFELTIRGVEPGLLGAAIVCQSLMLLAGAVILAAASFSSLFLISYLGRRF